MPNVMWNGMLNKLKTRMVPIKCRIKVANGDSGRLFGALTDVLVSMVELNFPIDVLVIEESPYYVII